jgi:hypothetical protein
MMERHPDGHIGGTCVGCGHKPIWYVEGHPPLCVRGELVEKNTRPLTGGVTEVTDAMIEAGCEAMSKVHAAMRDRNLSDEPETMDDFDEGDVCRAIYLAMSNVSRGVK